MSTTVATIPKPLSGDEIKSGIAFMMTSRLPGEAREQIRSQIEFGLRKCCSVTPGMAYSRFSAEWTMTWWRDGEQHRANWWVTAQLDDYGRLTPMSIGETQYEESKHAASLSGEISFTPPDRFRRETSQSVPAAVELKKPEDATVTISRAARLPRNRGSV